MKCEGCGAEVMLGSAQCERCGRSLLGGPPPPPPPAPRPAPPRPAQPLPAPPPSRQRLGVPPPGVTPRPAPALKASSRTGCLPVIVLISVLAAGAGIFAAARGGSEAVDAIGDAIDSASDDGFDGRPVEGGPLALDEAVEAAIDDDEVGTHALDAGEGRVTISVAGTGDFDPVLRVLAGDGDVLGEDDDGGDGRDSQLSLTLPGGAGVVVEVREFSGDAGSYVVLARRGDAETGIAPSAGPALTIGVPVAGVVSQDGAVAHPFTGAGRTVRITVEGIDGFDPVLVVRSGTQVLGENDDADGRDSRLDLHIPEGLAVSVEVSGFAGRAGSYRVLVA